jgi:hypothetical protein
VRLRHLSMDQPVRRGGAVFSAWRLTGCLALSISLAACGRAPIATPISTSMPDPYPGATATSADPYPHGTPVTPPPSPVLPTTTPSATRTPTPAPVTSNSPLVLDSAAERVYASRSEGATSDLLVYDSRDGHLIERKPLEPGEELLDIDRDRRRLYIYHRDRGVRLLSADDLAPVGAFPLPTPDPADSLGQYIIVGRIDPLLPLVDPTNGQILTIHELTVTARDPDTGQPVREFQVPLPDGPGPVYRAAVSESGRLLYLAIAAHDLADWESQPGTILLALDLASGTIVDRRDLHALATGWLAWGESLLATTEVHKDIGVRHSLWHAGREQLQQFESNLQWTAYDSKRDQLVGVTGWPFANTSIAIADAATLRLRNWNKLAGRAAPTVYDPNSDQFYAIRADQLDRLDVIAAASLTAELAAEETPVSFTQVWGEDAVVPPVQSRDGGSLLIGVIHATPGPKTPTPTGGSYEYLPVLSRDGGHTWSIRRPAGLPAWPYCLAPSPDFAQDQTIFGCVSGLGVFRSQDGGRSWVPASDGLGGLAVREIAVSPDFARDRTLFAVTFPGIQSIWHPEPERSPESTPESTEDRRDTVVTTWRSRDAGEHWEPIGPYSALAVSPDFGRDRTVMGFQSLDSRFFTSTDGGDNWQPGGKLPRLMYAESVGTRLWVVPATADQPRVLLALGNSSSAIGGGPHWPESGARVFSSNDDGQTWDLAWEAEGDLLAQAALDGTLIGPIWPSPPSRMAPTWLLMLENRILLLGDSEAAVLSQYHLPDDPEAYPIAALPDGKLLVAGGKSGELREVALDAFVRGAPPTPAR